MKKENYQKQKTLMHLILQAFIVGSGSATFLVEYEIDCSQAEGREKQFLGDIETAKAGAAIPCRDLSAEGATCPVFGHHTETGS